MTKVTANLLGRMTAGEKAAFAAGVDMRYTAKCERLGVGAIELCDGPHGLHRPKDGADDSLSSYDSLATVSFPSGSCGACCWDPELFAELGRALGEAAAARGVSVLLGPAINIKRSPLGGRNFEYLSEDPYLTGELAAAYTIALQKTGVSAAVKHFAANSQEKWRLTVDEGIDERVLRELYFPAFEKQVMAGVDVVMSAYNRINGVSCSENEWLLTQVLRRDWGFTGMVVSDWGAVRDLTAALKAGNNLKMPGLFYEKDRDTLLAAMDRGELSEAELGEGISPVLDLITRQRDLSGVVCDEEKNHALAERIAEESITLLKNEGALPLARGQRLLILGEFAGRPRFQGGGSSRVNPYRTENTLASFESGGWDYEYIPKYDDLPAILAAAAGADRVIVFAGLSDAEESEGFDRDHLDLAEEQNAAISALGEVHENLTVVLFNGSAVLMPWVDRVKAVLECFLPGEAGGRACYRILTGEVNPSGKLAETFPVKLQDNPSYLNFPGENERVHYAEGLFVGYRYYEKKGIAPLFPFGHGKSYTTFDYRDLQTEKDRFSDGETINVTFELKNTGPLPGKEVCQLYVACQDTGRIRPLKQLAGFRKVPLEPGEEAAVTMTLDFRSFAYFNTDTGDWRTDSAHYTLLAGSSSADIRLSRTIYVESSNPYRRPVTQDTTFEDAMKTEKGRALILPLLNSLNTGIEDPAEEAAYRKMILAMPVKSILLTGVPPETLGNLVAQLNAP